MMIYRVEDHEGYGPYCTPNANSEYWNVINVSMNSVGMHAHPVPNEDGISEAAFTSEHYFGFDSIESLSDWFPGLVQNVDKLLSWRISTYEIDPAYVLVGYSQVVFKRNMATKKGVYNA